MTEETAVLVALARKELQGSSMDIEIVALKMVTWRYNGILAERSRLKAILERYFILETEKAGGK
jgi:hypothetical protein